MIKKSFGLAILLCSSGYGDIGGFYIGGHVGGAVLTGEHQYTSTAGAGKQKVKAFGMAMGAHGGYIYEMANRSFMGGEVYYSITTPSGKINIGVKDGPVEGKATLNHKKSMGAKAKFGMSMNPKVFVFASLGYESATFELKYDQLTYGTKKPETYSKSVTALIPGLGGVYRMTPKLWVGAEYGFATYGKIEPRKDTSAVNGTQRGYAFRPTEHRLVVTVSYKF